MTSILAVVLVCSAAIAGPDCDRGNALDVIVQPAATVAACQRVGQTMAAQAFGAPGPDRYLKVGCERRKG